MQTRLPSSASPATLGRNCALQRSHSSDRHSRGRSSFRVHAEAPHERISEEAPVQAHSNSNGNGVSNGKGNALISSNNGVVLDRKGGSLEDRISSGEFGSQGSTRERALRPIRQALAKDTLGPGTSPPAQS